MKDFIKNLLRENLLREDNIPQWNDLVQINGNYYVVYDNEIAAQDAIVYNEQGVNLLSEVFDDLKGNDPLDIVNDNESIGDGVRDGFDELVDIFKSKYSDNNLVLPSELKGKKDDELKYLFGKLVALYIIKYNALQLNGYIEFKDKKVYVRVPDNYFGDENYESGNEFLIKSKMYEHTVSLKSIEDGNITDNISVKFINQYIGKIK